MAASWQQLSNPAVDVANSVPLFLTADGLRLVCQADNASVSPQLQLYDIAADTWGPVCTCGDGATVYSMTSVSPVFNGKFAVCMQENASPFKVLMQFFDATTGARSQYAYSIDHLTCALISASGVVFGCNFYMVWFSNNPGIIGLYFPAAGSGGDPTAQPILCFEIDTGACVGLALCNPSLSSTNEFSESQNGGYPVGVISTNSPTGYRWRGPIGGGAGIPALLGNIATLAPANMFSGRPTTPVVLTNATGFASPVTLTLPYVSLGELATTALDTFQQALLTASSTGSFLGSCGSASFGTYTPASPEYTVTLHPFDFVGESMGATTTLAVPSGFTASGPVSVASGAGDTVYIQSPTLFYKMVFDTPPPPTPTAPVLPSGNLGGVYRGQVGINFYGKALVGDFVAGLVGALNFNTFTEYGNAMIGQIASPPVHSKRRRVFMPKFEIDIESGVGLTVGQGSDPVWMLEVSKDGGRTWGPQQPWRSMGKLGRRLTRLRWLKLGEARQWVFRLTASDPVRRTIIGVWIAPYEGLA